MPTPEEIKKARKAARLTQYDAAALVYRTKVAWQKWEYGERNMPQALFELFKLKTKEK